MRLILPVPPFPPRTSTRSPVDISMETAEVAYTVERVWKGLQVLEEAFHTISFVLYIPTGSMGV